MKGRWLWAWSGLVLLGCGASDGSSQPNDDGGRSGLDGGGTNDGAVTGSDSTSQFGIDSGSDDGNPMSLGPDGSGGMDDGSAAVDGIAPPPPPHFDGGCATPPPPSTLVGWATQGGMTTTGGEGGATVRVTTMAALQSAVSGTNAQVVEVVGPGIIETGTGGLNVGSNKTIVGVCGATIHGHIQYATDSSNVILRNLKLVGFNCQAPDVTPNVGNGCKDGLDVITVKGPVSNIAAGPHHLWFDHDDISDGTDGNLDMTRAVDYVTVSWTKFSYSKNMRPGLHEFSNLIGHVDNNPQDVGRLNITFHHDWWADNIDQRMPRVRYGKVHLFNDLYTASGCSYAVGVGFDANIRSENDVFIGIGTPTSAITPSSASAFHSIGDLPAIPNINGSPVFTPPYSYVPDAPQSVEAAVRAGVGPQ